MNSNVAAQTPSRSVMRPTLMEVDLSALKNNFRNIKSHVGTAKVMAVVKANAYGHGLIPCARTLENTGADYFGVALVEEGVRLRKAGITKPILIFGGIFGEQISVYLDYNLDLTASSIGKLQAIDEVAAQKKVRARVHIKVDTGMGRIGVRPETAPTLLEAALKTKFCDVVGVFTHFASADEQDLEFSREQLSRFKEVAEFFPRHGLPTPLRHAANTAAILQYPESHLDMVRPGIGLFGVSPATHLKSVLPLAPVMKVSSRVVFFKVVLPGHSVSYGRTWKAQQPSRVVTIPVGYGDGYSRALSNKGEVLIRGNRCPIVGRVCMDQIMVDIKNGEAYNSDEVVLIGKQEGQQITVEELAERIGTIPYEVLTALNLRIPRTFLEEGKETYEEGEVC